MSNRHILIGIAGAIVYAALQITILPMLANAHSSGFSESAWAVVMQAGIGIIYGLLMYAAPVVAGFMAPRDPVRIGIVVAGLGQLAVAFASRIPYLQYELGSEVKFRFLSDYLERLPFSLFLCVTASCAGAYFFLQRTSNNSLKLDGPNGPPT